MIENEAASDLFIIPADLWMTLRLRERSCRRQLSRNFIIYIESFMCVENSLSKSCYPPFDCGENRGENLWPFGLFVGVF